MVAYRSLGSVSTYSNAGTEPAKMLGIIPPAGIEQFFEDIEGTSGPPEMEKIMALAAKYNVEMVGPPSGQ